MLQESPHFSREGSGGFKCPLCEEASEQSQSVFINHLYLHMKEPSYFPYQCNMPACSYISRRLADMRRHVTDRHKAVWSDELVSSPSSLQAAVPYPYDNFRSPRALMPKRRP